MRSCSLVGCSSQRSRLGLTIPRLLFLSGLRGHGKDPWVGPMRKKEQRKGALYQNASPSASQPAKVPQSRTRRKVSGTPTRPCPQYFHLLLRTTRIAPILQRGKQRHRNDRKLTEITLGVYYICSLAPVTTVVHDKTCRVHQAILTSPQCVQGPGVRQRKGL